MRPRILIVAPLVAVLAVVTTGAAPAGAAPPTVVHVGAQAEYFLPSVVSVSRGGTVTWDFVDSHTATDATHMGVYDSGTIDHSSFSYRFVAAGAYPFTCTIHTNMNGRVDVPIFATPSKGSITRAFTLIWSSVVAPTGFVFDVQKRRAGSPWAIWAAGTTARTSVFRPWRVGTYRFRARMRQMSSGFASGWSDAVTIAVS